MEKIIEKMGIYDLLSVLVGGAICVASIKAMDISFCSFVAKNIGGSLSLVYLVISGILVGTIIQEISSFAEKKYYSSRFGSDGVKDFLDENNMIITNSLELNVLRKKAVIMLKKYGIEKSEKNENGTQETCIKFDKDEACYVFQKMKEEVSNKEGYGRIERINSLASFSRSLCIWFAILPVLYFIDALIRFFSQSSLVIPYPMGTYFIQWIQVILVCSFLFLLSICMYRRTKRYRDYRIRAMVRLYLLYDELEEKKSQGFNT